MLKLLALACLAAGESGSQEVEGSGEAPLALGEPESTRVAKDAALADAVLKVCAVIANDTPLAVREAAVESRQSQGFEGVATDLRVLSNEKRDGKRVVTIRVTLALAKVKSDVEETQRLLAKIPGLGLVVAVTGPQMQHLVKVFADDGWKRFSTDDIGADDFETAARVAAKDGAAYVLVGKLVNQRKTVSVHLEIIDPKRRTVVAELDKENIEDSPDLGNWLGRVLRKKLLQELRRIELEGTELTLRVTGEVDGEAMVSALKSLPGVLKVELDPTRDDAVTVTLHTTLSVKLVATALKALKLSVSSVHGTVIEAAAQPEPPPKKKK